MHTVLTFLFAFTALFIGGSANANAANMVGETPDVLPLDKDGKPIERPIPIARSAEERKIEEILQQGLSQAKGQNLIVFYSKMFEGRPYVAKTLDRDARRESLVVDLDGVDCTTFVELVVALTLTTREQSDRYGEFKDNLRKIRYRGGTVSYECRNHYFSQWIHYNSERGVVKELTGKANDKRGAYYPYTATQTLKLNYMSTHTDQYPQLIERPNLVELIKYSEHQFDNKTVRYIPKRFLGRSKQSLGIEDGDIIAIVTNKKGLDTSHIGFAFWGTDNKLHLINASSIHKMVVFEPMTLQEYMNEHPSQLGIRVIRLK